MMNSSFKIFKVSNYDSRIGSHSYSMWTSGSTYALEVEGEDPVFVGYRSYESTYLVEGSKCFNHTNPIPPKEEWELVRLDEVPRTVRARLWALSGIPLMTGEEEKEISSEKEEVSSKSVQGEAPRLGYTATQWPFVRELKKTEGFEILKPFEAAITPGPDSRGNKDGEVPKGAFVTSVDMYMGYGYAIVPVDPSTD